MGHNKLWLFSVPFYLIGYMVGLIIVLINAIWIPRWKYLVIGPEASIRVAKLQIACGFIQSVAAYALYYNGFSTACWWVLLGPSLAYCLIIIGFKMLYWFANIFIR